MGVKKAREVMVADVQAVSRTVNMTDGRKTLEMQFPNNKKRRSTSDSRALRRFVYKLSCCTVSREDVKGDTEHVNENGKIKGTSLRVEFSHPSTTSSAPESRVEFYDMESECFYSASSVMSGGRVESENGDGIVQMQALNATAPAPIPPGTFSRLNPLVMTIPAFCGVDGKWMKDPEKSSPVPGPCDSIIKASFFVQRIRNRMKELQIVNRTHDMLVIFKLNIPGMDHWVEKYPKDGALSKIKFRRDYKKGRAFGQAFVLPDGRTVTRVWNLGSTPEVMWEEVFQLQNPNKIRIDHYVYTLDGEKKGHQWSIGYMC